MHRGMYMAYISRFTSGGESKKWVPISEVDHGYFGKCEHFKEICLSQRIKQKQICKFKVELIYSSMYV